MHIPLNVVRRLEIYQLFKYRLWYHTGSYLFNIYQQHRIGFSESTQLIYSSSPKVLCNNSNYSIILRLILLHWKYRLSFVKASHCINILTVSFEAIEILRPSQCKRVLCPVAISSYTNKLHFMYDYKIV